MLDIGEPLFVTLVTGSDPRHRVRVMSSIAPTRWSISPMDGADPATLAESVLAAANEGLRGRLAIALHAEHDVMEVALTLQSVFRDRADSERPVHVRDVIAVVGGAELDTVLDHRPQRRPDRHTALIERVEFATIVLAHGVRRREALDLVRAVNPTAAVLVVDHPSAVSAEQVSCAVRPPVGDLSQHQGWMRALNGIAHQPRHVTTEVFRDPRPFHPGRLHHVVQHCLTPDRVGVIWRSRGLVRLASRIHRVGSWSSVGSTLSLDPTALTSDDPDAPSGQEIAFFGSAINATALRNALGAALLSTDELLAGPMEWAGYTDDFPAWHLDHSH